MVKMLHSYQRTCIYSEIHQNIRTIELFVRGHECPEKLTVQENHILINYNNTKESKISLPVKIDPSTVNTIQQHKNEGISLKFSAHPNANLNSPKLSEYLGRYKTMVCYLERGPTQCGCKTCGLTLFKQEAKFTRVLPLPTKAWVEQFSSWTCCAHSDQACDGKKPSGCKPNSKLRPREGDCLIGENYFAVHGKNILVDNLKFKKNKCQPDKECTQYTIKCCSCLSVLGECEIVNSDLDSDTKHLKADFKMYKNAVTICSAAIKSTASSSTETVVRPIFYSEFFMERIFAHQLQSSTASMSHMLAIQDSAQTFMLLVKVLNNTTTLCMSSDSTSKPFRSKCCIEADCKMLKKLSLEEKNASGDCTTSNTKLSTLSYLGCTKAATVDRLFSFSPHHFHVAKEHSAKERICMEPHKEKVLKVFFACTTPKTTNKFYTDFISGENSVVLTYPLNMVIDMAMVLAANSLTMPVAKRKSLDAGFCCSFLRTN